MFYQKNYNPLTQFQEEYLDIPSTIATVRRPTYRLHPR